MPNRDRGFGFIRTQSRKEVFFHRSALKQCNFDHLEQGQRVEFDLERGEKAQRASNVRVTGIGVQLTVFESLGQLFALVGKARRGLLNSEPDTEKAGQI